jgi:hypothetical protein
MIISVCSGGTICDVRRGARNHGKYLIHGRKRPNGHPAMCVAVHMVQ